MTGDVVLVTGASRGIGLETALTLASRGFRVFAGLRDMRDMGHVLTASAARQVSVTCVPLDVTDRAVVRETVTSIVRSAGSLYGVVNNAAVTVRGYFEDLDEREIRHILDVNLLGTMNVTREALPHLRQAGRGRFVMMSSVGGRIGSMALTAYVSSKFAIEGFSESLSLELAPLGIQVVIVEPGITETDIWHGNRHIAVGARSHNSPYADWFARAEQQADALVKTSRIKPVDIADTIARALGVTRPRLRYTVGRRASLVMSLRRHLPGEMFERFYFAEVIRRVTGGRPARGAQQA